MNKVIFAKLYVTCGEITGHQLSEAAGQLVEANTAARTYYRRSDTLEVAADVPYNDSSPFLEEEAGWGHISDADLLAVTAWGHGSSKAVVVGDTGIEPVTSSV